jgi:hypothetical protein
LKWFKLLLIVAIPSGIEKMVDAVELQREGMLLFCFLFRLFLVVPFCFFVPVFIFFNHGFSPYSVETKLNFNHSELSFLKLEYLAKISVRKEERTWLG